MLVVGFICNLLVRPVAEKHFMTPEQEASSMPRPALATADWRPRPARQGRPRPAGRWQLAWLAVGIPIAWGVWVTLQQAAKLFVEERHTQAEAPWRNGAG